MGFPGDASGKELACQCKDARDVGSIPRSGRSPGEGNDYPLQDSCLKNSIDRGASWAIIHRVAKSQTRLSDFQYTNTLTGTARNNVYQLSGLP